MPRNRKVPSEALEAEIRLPFLSKSRMWIRPLGSRGNSKSITSIGVSSRNHEVRTSLRWLSEHIALSTVGKLSPDSPNLVSPGTEGNRIFAGDSSKNAIEMKCIRVSNKTRLHGSLFSIIWAILARLSSAFSSSLNQNSFVWKIWRRVG